VSNSGWSSKKTRRGDIKKRRFEGGHSVGEGVKLYF